MRPSYISRPLVLLALSLAVLCASSCEVIDEVACAVPNCEFTSDQWTRLKGLAGLGAAPDDRSNKYSTRDDAAELGKKLYFDTRFSGNVTMLDSVRRPVPYARAALGQPAGIACVSCHDPKRAGADFTSVPNRVSIGAGWYDVNSQQTVNAAHYKIIYWNARTDSLWAQAAAVTESFFSMGSNRLKVVWLLKQKYAAAYNAVFSTDGHTLEFLPDFGTVAAIVEPATKPDGTPNPRSGQCVLVNGACPQGCSERPNATAGGPAVCWPRFPLQGRPGAKAGCQAGLPTEPFGDAFDCMAAEDRTLVTRAFVNFSKAIAAYEQRLVSGNSRFDRFIEQGAKSAFLSDAEKRGAALFVGKGSCVDCHNTPLLSDSRLHNIGVPSSGDPVPTERDCPAGGVCDCVNGVNCLPWGGYDGILKLKASTLRRTGAYSDDPTDVSRQEYVDMVPDESLKGTWRTPSLRDVAVTAPYMHDGAYQSLEEVVEAYDRGGASSGFSGTKSVQIQPLHLTQTEKSDLVAFLNALTGQPLPDELVTAPVLPP